MSDESKVWLARIAFWVTSTIDTTLLLKVASDAGGKGGVSVGWTLLLLLVTGITVYNWLLLHRSKANRGKQANTSLNQIEVEALAAYGADIIKKRQEQGSQAATDKPTPNNRQKVN